MGCNCGGSAASQQQAYQVIVNGKTVDKEFSSKPEADIYATMHNGRVIAKSK
jgi:hypothetical protein